MTLHAADAGSLVGRARELDALTAALREAVDSRRCVTVLVAGEPGIGKSALLRAFRPVAEAAGALVLAGEADELASTTPFQPIRDALLPYVTACDPARLASLLQDKGEVAHVLPEVRQLLPELPAAVPISPQSETYRLFESVTAFVSAIAREHAGGLAMFIEDLHWADESSLALVRHLSRRLSTTPALLVLSYRDTEVTPGTPLVAAIEALARSPGGRRIDLPRLSRAETRDLISVLVRPHPPVSVVDYVYAQTDGNPFLVKELVSALHHSGRLLDDAGAWKSELDVIEGDLPRGVLLIAAGRMNRAGHACREALLAAAVLGRDFDFATLESVTGIESAALLDALDEATRLGLIEPSPRGMRFSHELVRQALLGELSPPRRQQLHLKAARALQQARSGNGHGRAYDLAHHLFQAGPLAPSEEAVLSALQAGDEAMARLAYADAARFFGMAVERLEHTDRTHEEDALFARLLVRRGDALLYLSRYRDARPDFERAASMLPPEQRVDTLVPLALSSIWSEDMAAARQATGEADALITQLGRDDLRPAVEAVIAYCETNDGDVTGAIQRFRDATRLPGYSRVGAHSRLLTQFPVNLYWTGQFDEAVEQAQAGVLMARRANDNSELAGLLASLGLALAACGRYREAADAFEEGLQLGANLASEAPSLVILSKSAGFHIDTFDYEGAKAIASRVYGPARAIRDYPYPAISSGIDLIALSAREGDLETARLVGQTVQERIEREQGRHGFLWRMRLAEARAEVALAAGDYEAALGYADDALAQSRAVTRPKYQALSLQVRGRALMGLKRRPEAVESLREALEVARPTGDPAMFFRAAAGMLEAEPDDALLAEALEASERILANLPESMVGAFEASPQVRLVRELQARKPKPAEERLLLPAGLSPREFEVLQLLAGGRSNQQIADALVLSVRTVERHINHVYAKLGVHSRTQATAYVLREGLLPPEA